MLKLRDINPARVATIGATKFLKFKISDDLMNISEMCFDTILFHVELKL